jgi:hypothetical protein
MNNELWIFEIWGFMKIFEGEKAIYENYPKNEEKNIVFFS